MAEIDASISQSLSPTQSVDASISVLPYGTIRGGDVYFAERLRADSWTTASESDKLKALTEATEIVDRLSYQGCKTDPNQSRQFPRGGDTMVPTAIQRAAYEIAIKLLDGIDPDMEYGNLGVTSNSFDRVKITREPAFAAQGLANLGIPSLRAWQYLLPFLRDPRGIRLDRIS